jgi:flagellar hook-basal body protein
VTWDAATSELRYLGTAITVDGTNNLEPFDADLGYPMIVAPTTALRNQFVSSTPTTYSVFHDGTHIVDASGDYVLDGSNNRVPIATVGFDVATATLTAPDTTDITGVALLADGATAPPHPTQPDTRAFTLLTNLEQTDLPGVIDPPTYHPTTGQPLYDSGDSVDPVTGETKRTWFWDAVEGDSNRGLLMYKFNDGEELQINLGARGSDDNITQFAADRSQTLSITKDGSPTSTLTGIEIDETGLMDAIYDTGFRKTLYKIPIANVQNPNGMRTQDGQAFSLTRESGSVYFYDAGEGPTGSLVSSALEESTTDVAEELTQLIKTQRAYSSNAKIIQTVDEMLQETTNLKR